eukprot:848364-Prorocentrum_minimum.AAC.1
MAFWTPPESVPGLSSAVLGTLMRSAEHPSSASARQTCRYGHKIISAIPTRPDAPARAAHRRGDVYTCRTSSGATVPSSTRPKRAMMRQVALPKAASSFKAASRCKFATLSPGFFVSTCQVQYSRNTVRATEHCSQPTTQLPDRSTVPLCDWFTLQ